MNRAVVLSKLRKQVEDSLLTLEQESGLKVEFESLPDSSDVVAQYSFTPAIYPTIYLRSGWEDVDVAHELTHMRLELIEGYSVLAWRAGQKTLTSIERAFGRVRAYVDDEVVHARLARCSYQIDGEVLKPQLFDHVYKRVTSKLKKPGRAGFNDGMMFLDDIDYGGLCRSSFLVQARLILESYSEALRPDHLKRLKRFIEAFTTYLLPETNKADRILTFFRDHDVQSVDGHKWILLKWAQIEGLDQYVGASSYRRQESGHGYLLPCPTN